MIFVDNETIVGKMNILERWIIFHSILYYNLDDNIVSDQMFDMNGKQLYSLILTYSKEFKLSKYYYVMSDYEGASGFGLYERLSSGDKLYFNKTIEGRNLWKM